jgi:uncharacterized protein YkwD
VVTVRTSIRRISPAQAVVLAIVSLFVFVEPLTSRPAASTHIAHASVVGAPPSAIDANFASVGRVLQSASTDVRTMRSLINQTRLSFNRGGLRLNTRLSGVAQRHSARMAKLNRLHHNPNLVKDVGSMPGKTLGENVGVGSTVNSLHKAFMDSASHRSNILRRPYRLVGIGVVLAKGRTWVTVVFYG